MGFFTALFLYILILFVLVFLLIGLVYVLTIFGEAIGNKIISNIYIKGGQKKALKYLKYLNFILYTLLVLMILLLIDIIFKANNDYSPFWSFFYLIGTTILMLTVAQMRTKIEKYKQSSYLPNSIADFFQKRFSGVMQKKRFINKKECFICQFKNYIKYNVKCLLNSKTVSVTIYIVLINYVLLQFLVTVGFSDYDELGSYLAILLVVPFSMVFWIYFNNSGQEEKNFRRIIMYIVALLITIYLGIATIGKSDVLFDISEFIIFLFTVVFVFGDQIVNLVVDSYSAYKDRITNTNDR